MEDQIIVWEMPDGAVRYATCPEKSKQPGETIEQWLPRQFQKTVRDAFPGAIRILNPSMPDGQPFVPGAKKSFYGAWTSDGSGKIQVDLPRAREIHLAEVRAERNRKLDESDREWARLADVGTTEQQAAYREYRQALRDVPQGMNLDMIDTVVELEEFRPSWPGQP